MAYKQGVTRSDGENANLLLELAKQCIHRQSAGGKPEVILLIGQNGAGKSAFINTVHRVLTGQHFLIAKQGQGSAHTVTRDLIRYDNCGITSRDNIAEDAKRDNMRHIVSSLPHFFDCAGFGNENTPEMRELLELIIGGFIPDGTSIVALVERQKQRGVGYMKYRYNEPDPSLRVTKVVFVQSCKEAIPKNLVDCLKEILKIMDPRTLQRKYTGDVFVLITKYDCVQKSEKATRTIENLTCNDEDIVTWESFQEIEDKLSIAFSINGAQKLSSVRWISMTDVSSPDYAYIENIALKFLKRLVEPGTPRPTVKDPVIDWRKEILLFLITLRNQAIKYLYYLYEQAKPLVEEYVPMNVAAACLGVALVVYMLYVMLGAKP